MYTTLIIVNAHACNGKALKKWACIQPEVTKLIPGIKYELISYTPSMLQWKINEFIQRKDINCFISAGGDGAINHLINILYRIYGHKLDRITIGGIGLGSSNDFIKPAKKIFKKIPVRLDFDNIIQQDLGIVKFCNCKKNREMRCFIINASLGVTAEANGFFNSNNGIIHFLKDTSTMLAIWYAAIRSIFCYKNIPAIVRENGTDVKMGISNLAVIKQNYISGGFRYDSMISLDDGFLGLNYCYDMNKIELLHTLSDLLKGHFSGRAKRIARRIKEFSVKPHDNVSIETDGEVFYGKDIQFSVIPKAINVLGI
jgi:diacylglycerol kinase (ATP)